MATNYLRPREVADCQNDRAGLEAQLNQPFKKLDAESSGNIRAAVKSVNERMAQAPPELTAEQRTAVDREVKRLEAELQVGMLSAEEMRRCPPGAAEQNTAWERRNKPKVLKWKNLILALNRGASQVDLSYKLNIARLRPRMSRLNMEGAVVPQERAFVRGFGGDHPNGLNESDWAGVFPDGPEAKRAVAVKGPTAEELLAEDEGEFAGMLNASFPEEAKE